MLAATVLHGQTYTYSTFAGFADDPGASDGNGTDSNLPLFSNPSGLVVNSAGNLIVADSSNALIRVVTPAGVVTTLAGERGVSGFTDGIRDLASFAGPQGPAIDSAGNIYVADYNGSTIRKITPAGVVTTLAGTGGATGAVDATGSAARFNGPTGVAVDSAGNVYVVDSYNSAIRQVTPAGVVTSFAGLPGTSGTADGTGTAARFYQPRGIAIDKAGNLYVADTANNTIRKITSAGVVTTLAGLPGTYGNADGTGSAARFNFPNALTVDGAGNIYVADEINNVIRLVTPAGVVTTLAGNSSALPGAVDGTGSAARFYRPTGVALDSAGNIYVTDYANQLIRKVTTAGVVTTIAGDVTISGDQDGTGYTLTPVLFALFKGPASTTTDSAGNVYVADTRNNIIRKITPSGTVTTLAGNYSSVGFVDGTGTNAYFNSPSSVASDSAGNIYVADTNNQLVRMITPAGVVTTLAGTAGTTGKADGTGVAATFNYPSGVTVDTAGNVYVSDYYNYTIRKIAPGGVVTTLAGNPGTAGHADGTGSAATFSHPRSLAVDGSGNVFVADTGNHTIRKVTPGGIVTTLAGTAGTVGHADATGASASFDGPAGVAVDGSGNVFVADTNNSTVRQITQAGVVSTIGGIADTPGITDGVGTAAQFDHPTGLAVDPSGNLYVADNRNHTIRKGSTPNSSGGGSGSGSGGSGSSGSGSGGSGSGSGSGGSGSGSGGTGTQAGAGFFLHPGGLAQNLAAAVIVADTANHTIKLISAGGAVSGIAGKDATSGSADATLGSNARFSSPTGLAVNSVGSIFVADTGNGTIREINATGAITTFAGSAGNHGTADGTGSAARFSNPTGLVLDGSNNLYVTDTANNTIRKIDTAGVVTTIAGQAKVVGDADGVGTAALFNNPTGMTIDSSSNIYVADTYNNTIRKINLVAIPTYAADGTTVVSTIPQYTVTTLAGSAGISGAYDGTGIYALFNLPSGLTIDSLKNIYVADTGNNCVRRITGAGVVTTIAGIAGIAGNRDGANANALFNQPQAVMLGLSFYVADTGNSLIRVIQPASNVITPTLVDSTTINTGTGTTTTTPGTVTVIPDTGGGGAPSLWFYSSLLLLGFGRFLRRKR